MGNHVYLVKTGDGIVSAWSDEASAQHEKERLEGQYWLDNNVPSFEIVRIAVDVAAECYSRFLVKFDRAHKAVGVQLVDLYMADKPLPNRIMAQKINEYTVPPQYVYAVLITAISFDEARRKAQNHLDEELARIADDPSRAEKWEES